LFQLAGSWDVDSKSSKLDLTISASVTEHEITRVFEYNTNLFQSETIIRMVGHWQNFLRAIATEPDQTLNTLSLLSIVEIRLLQQGNTTQVSYPQDVCIHQLFEEQAARTPDRLAIFLGLPAPNPPSYHLKTSVSALSSRLMANASSESRIWFLNHNFIGPPARQYAGSAMPSRGFAMVSFSL
jgi:hypothetical protein